MKLTLVLVSYCPASIGTIYHYVTMLLCLGYEAAKFVHSLLKRHECPICLYAMKNPVQTECGHLFCRECLEPVLRRRRPICPLDKEEITREGIFPDNACRKEILNLDVYCNYVAGGCTWMGQLKDLDVGITRLNSVMVLTVSAFAIMIVCTWIAGSSGVL